MSSLERQEFFVVASSESLIDTEEVSKFRFDAVQSGDHPLERQRPKLALVKGGKGSRLLKKAKLISSIGEDRNGKPLKVLSPAMWKIFSDFDGRGSIQRSPPRWVRTEFVERAIEFVRSLE